MCTYFQYNVLVSHIRVWLADVCVNSVGEFEVQDSSIGSNLKKAIYHNYYLR